MAQDRPAHIVVDLDNYERVDPLTWFGTWIVASDGAKLVLANRPTLDALRE
jgi:hypothetical protein